MTVATVQPMSMGRKRSLRPIIMGMPTGMSMQLAMEKVAPEIEVCRRFCRWMLLNFLKTRRGIRDSTTANSAPMIDVLAVTPVRTISSMPMILPSVHIMTPKIRHQGSYHLGCSFAVIFFWVKSSTSQQLTFLL